MNTVVISAFSCSGKSFAFNHYQDKYSMLDSDSSEFSWLKDKNGINTKTRNPDFPANYIQHIKDNIGKVDIIFVSSHKEVRVALDAAKIVYCTVYPSANLLNEWVGRMYRRGNKPEFIEFIINNWDGFMQEIKDGKNSGRATYHLLNNEYLGGYILEHVVICEKIKNSKEANI